MGKTEGKMDADRPKESKEKNILILWLTAETLNVKVVITASPSGWTGKKLIDSKGPDQPAKFDPNQITTVQTDRQMDASDHTIPTRLYAGVITCIVLP